MRIVGERGGFRSVEPRRLAALVAVCVLAAMTIEDDLALHGAAPDFVLIAVAYVGLASGAAGGALAGFGLGVFRDALFLEHFGLHALGFTMIGYGVGKIRETVYLQTWTDLLLVAGGKVAIDALVLTVIARGAWTAFEVRFFWETPWAALYTAALGGALYRLFRR